MKRQTKEKSGPIDLKNLASLMEPSHAAAVLDQDSVFIPASIIMGGGWTTKKLSRSDLLSDQREIKGGAREANSLEVLIKENGEIFDKGGGQK